MKIKPCPLLNFLMAPQEISSFPFYSPLSSLLIILGCQATKFSLFCNIFHTKTKVVHIYNMIFPYKVLQPSGKRSF